MVFLKPRLSAIKVELEFSNKNTIYACNLKPNVNVESTPILKVPLYNTEKLQKIK